MSNRLKYLFGLFLGILFVFSANAHEAADMPSLSKGDYGMSFVTWYGNNSYSIAYGVTLYVDPVNIPEGQAKADAILLTHTHPENFSITDIQKLLGGYTHIYGPADVIARIRDEKLKVGEDQLHIIKPFEEVVTGSYSFRTVPAYNTTKALHPQENDWLGYIISVLTPRGDAKLYFSGDTNKIVEMDDLNGKVDVAFISINKEHGMDSVLEAVSAVTVIDPEIAVPMGYSGDVGSDVEADQFVGMLSEVDGIDGEMLNKK